MLLVALLFDIALGWSVLGVSLLKVCWCRIGEERLLAWKFSTDVASDDAACL